MAGRPLQIKLMVVVAGEKEEKRFALEKKTFSMQLL